MRRLYLPSINTSNFGSDEYKNSTPPRSRSPNYLENIQAQRAQANGLSGLEASRWEQNAPATQLC